MNDRDIRSIWTRWSQHRQNTAVIARKLKLKECNVASVIAQKINEQFMKRKKPFRQEVA